MEAYDGPASKAHSTQFHLTFYDGFCFDVQHVLLGCVFSLGLPWSDEEAQKKVVKLNTSADQGL